MKKAPIPVVFTPSNEPYLGRETVYQFDKMISLALERNFVVAMFTKENISTLSELQHAACQLIPHGFNVALSIRELIRQGYLYGAMVLLRPLVERAAIVSYLCENENGVTQWSRGWKHGDRPSFKQLLQAMGPGLGGTVIDITSSMLHGVVHGDPAGAAYCVEMDEENNPVGHPVGKILNSPGLCDNVCTQAMCYLFVLSARMDIIFPETISE